MPVVTGLDHRWRHTEVPKSSRLDSWKLTARALAERWRAHVEGWRRQPGLRSRLDSGRLVVTGYVNRWLYRDRRPSLAKRPSTDPESQQSAAGTRLGLAGLVTRWRQAPVWQSSLGSWRRVRAGFAGPATRRGVVVIASGWPAGRDWSRGARRGRGHGVGGPELVRWRIERLIAVPQAHRRSPCPSGRRWSSRRCPRSGSPRSCPRSPRRSPPSGGASKRLEFRATAAVRRTSRPPAALKSSADRLRSKPLAKPKRRAGWPRPRRAAGAEEERRQAEVEAARRAEEEQRRQAEIEATRRAEEERRRQAESEAAARDRPKPRRRGLGRRRPAGADRPPSGGAPARPAMPALSAAELTRIRAQAEQKLLGRGLLRVSGSDRWGVSVEVGPTGEVTLSGTLRDMTLYQRSHPARPRGPRRSRREGYRSPSLRHRSRVPGAERLGRDPRRDPGPAAQPRAPARERHGPLGRHRRGRGRRGGHSGRRRSRCRAARGSDPARSRSSRCATA